VDDVGPVDLQETEPFRLQNSLVTEVVRLFAEMQLGSRQEALLCVVPLMISHLKTPSPASVLAAAGKSATKQRRSNEWKKAEEMLRWVWKICIQSQSSVADTLEEDGNHQLGSKYTLAELATIALGELYRWALVDKRTFGMDGISWLEKQKSSHPVSICEVIDRYVAVANGVERDEVNSTDLFAATENACLTTTLLALTRPVSNMESEQKGNALCLAAKHGWAEVVRALLELNTEPDFQDAASRTPLSYAAENGNVDIARELIYSGSFPDLGCPQNRTPLSYASEAGAHRVVELLLRDIRVSPDRKDSSGLTPLCWAAKNAHEIVVEQLLDTGKVDPDAMKSSGGTPLWWAALEGHESIVQRLLDTGKVDPDARNGKNQPDKTPLSNAASKGHGTIVKLLLETDKVDPDSKDNWSRTPLYWAATEGHENVVKQLLETGKVDPDAMDQSGQTPLTQAAMKGHNAIVKLLLETGNVDPNARDQWNKTPLSWAARFGQSTVVKQLLEDKMVDPDAKDLQGQTPLWWARDSGHDTIVTQLLETGKVDPDPKATCGYFEANLAARKWKHPKRQGEDSPWDNGRHIMSAARSSEPTSYSAFNDKCKSLCGRNN
jgi:ankyrin repeat protein